MNNKYGRFLVLFFALGIAVFIGGSAQAATCNVPSGLYPTIQSAVNDLSCDPIVVAAGTYNEQVQITRTLSLQGVQKGVDARTRSGAESVITNVCGPVQIMADNVTVDGFTIEGSTNGDPCFLSGIWTNPGFSGTQGGHQILNNIVQNNISGIELDSTCVNPTLVQFNLIRNNNNPGPGSGNAIQTNFGLCNAMIDKNKFSGDTNGSVLVSSGGDDQQITVSNNELDGGFERIVFGSVDNSSIINNKSSGATSSGVIRLFGGNTSINVNGNLLANGVRGILVDDPFFIGPNSAIVAHNNCIQGNSTAGLEVGLSGHTGTLNAENNWWGDSSGPNYNSGGPGSGDKIIDPDGVVDFSPFSTSPVSACPPPPAPRIIKQNVRSSLNALLPTGTKATDDKIKKALADLDKSLDPALYVDDSHLTSNGGKVFDAEKAAVVDLLGIKNPPAAVSSAILSLVSADQAFAQTAIDEAIARNGKPSEISAAQTEMTKATQDISKGKYDSAIDHYKHAWEHAQKA